MNSEKVTGTTNLSERMQMTTKRAAYISDAKTIKPCESVGEKGHKLEWAKDPLRIVVIML